MSSSSSFCSSSDEEPLPGTTLRVDNLTTRVQKDHIYEIFGHYGYIKNVHLPVDTGISGTTRLGHAFVEFCAPQEAAEAARCMNGGLIDSKRVQVEDAVDHRISASDLGLM